ncbi:ketosteroid isomerase-related protein [Marimonas sp. MJW-29]|uniref:Ketosteroid isomerase-related protein n=1 Tax=Sulfitobacter sediminis TaxID=3234186 RepID=A0ABV3RRI4_9RHOB
MKDLIQRYFDAFNAHNTEDMLACLAPDVEHHVNEGTIRVGRTAFAEFCAHMSRCYDETLTDMVIFVNEDGTRAAAEYTVNGTYLETDGTLPPAHGQTYKLPAGSFFSIADGQITRVTTYYSLSGWTAQVS